LGEFTELEDYEAIDLPSIKFFFGLFFLLATMLSQIIFMNVLIAIISDSYAKIMEHKE